jgi:hypothetical protein
MSDKYKNGKIYTIRCKNDDTLIYVGSTVQPLFKRWFQHKKNLNNEKRNNIISYKKIRETNIEDWYIELYEEFACENKEQLNRREGEIIREIGTLNKQIAGRTYKEYNDDNKSKRKEYYEANKNKILEKKKDYYLKNKEYFQEYREVNKEHTLEYKKKYNKEYQQKNREKVTKYHNECINSKQTQQIT